MIEQSKHSHTLLGIYLCFRLALGLLLLILHYNSQTYDAFGSIYPSLFRWTIILYVVICAVALLIVPFGKISHSLSKISYSLIYITAQFFIDLICIIILIHASGGIGSGLGYLLLIYTAMGSMFLHRQLALFYAAIASLLLLGEGIFLTFIKQASASNLFSAGVLGILIFTTALAFRFFTEKINKSTLEALESARYAKHLERLARAIITRMRTGVIVIDNAGIIELINDSALQLLDLPADHYQGKTLLDISNLQPIFTCWLDNPNPSQPVIHTVKEGIDLRVSAAPLELGENERTVLYLEDHRTLTQQAQSLKLASLGRLTASIAHEVRNPLGAISHASQLLNESPELNQGDQRLTDIILQHAKRVNKIIEDTLELSRRKERQPDIINLNDWLNNFVSEYSLNKHVDFKLHLHANELLIRFDMIHLTQILTNLCDNGARYSLEKTGQPIVCLKSGVKTNQDTIYLEIIDAGDGISNKLTSQIFEPFFTTSEKGSGLGLYICNDLCEINQAKITYKRTYDKKSCFRIDFSHYKRMT